MLGLPLAQPAHYGNTPSSSGCARACIGVRTRRAACRDARQICLREYGDAPDVNIYGAEGLQFPYIPSHLHHIMFELTKNSLRAVADRFEYGDAPAPPIRVVISQGGEDITIKARPLSARAPVATLHAAQANVLFPFLLR